MSANRNEGEGNKTAPREYREAQRRLVSGGKVGKAARDVEGPELQKLLDTEAAGKSGAAPDPETNDHEVRARAYDIWEREGRPEGRHDEHWRQAQQELAGKAD
jgi:hypothetical protein